MGCLADVSRMSNGHMPKIQPEDEQKNERSILTSKIKLTEKNANDFGLKKNNREENLDERENQIESFYPKLCRSNRFLSPLNFS